jgi:hypothetical protein
MTTLTGDQLATMTLEEKRAVPIPWKIVGVYRLSDTTGLTGTDEDDA